MWSFSRNRGEILLILIILLSITFFVFSNLSSITGHITQNNIPSNVSVSTYLAISFGQNLSKGIEFGSVAFLPAQNVNATHNYDGRSNATTYFIQVSNDSNSPVDFCIKANAGLTSKARDIIGLGNETYSDSNSSNSLVPELVNQTPLNTTYIKTVSRDISPGSYDYWRFWLDVPSSQPSGNYNNTVSFKGVISGVSC